MFFKFSFFLLLFCTVLGLSCASEQTSQYPPELQREVSQLISNEEKIAFLEKLYLGDQRDRNTAIPHKQLIANDSIRLQKMSAYLDVYGYPSRSKLSKSAADTPYIILHHAPTNTARHKYFPLMYKAMLDGNISDRTLASFLGRFQKIENGKWIEFDRPFTTEEEIDTLLEALDLAAVVATLKDK